MKRSAAKTAVGLNQREENFCVEFARSGNASEAYVKAGYEAGTPERNRIYAHRLLKKAHIQLRVGQLRQGAALSAKMDVEYFLNNLKANIEGARELGDFGASNKALELGMRWLGMVGEKVTPAAQTNVNLSLFSSGDERKDLARLASISGYQLALPKEEKK